VRSSKCLTLFRLTSHPQNLWQHNNNLIKARLAFLCFESWWSLVRERNITVIWKTISEAVVGLNLLYPKSQGQPTRRVSQNAWNIIFRFLTLFQSFLKAYLCKLIQVDLFGVFRWNMRPQKILGNRILSAEFLSCWLLSKNASWPYFTPWTTYLSFREQKELITPLLTKVWDDVSPKKSLVFTGIKSEFLRRFKSPEQILPETNRWVPLKSFQKQFCAFLKALEFQTNLQPQNLCHRV